MADDANRGDLLERIRAAVETCRARPYLFRLMGAQSVADCGD